MSKCGYACMNCGQCRGELPKPILVPLCPECSFENEVGAEHCSQCGSSLKLVPGVTNMADFDQNGASTS